MQSVALAVLLLPVCFAQPQAPATAPNERGRILGIGGMFLKSANQQQLREWYSTHLGLVDKGGGVMLPWREKDNPETEHVTVWTVFPGSSSYFESAAAAGAAVSARAALGGGAQPVCHAPAPRS